MRCAALALPLLAAVLGGGATVAAAQAPSAAPAGDETRTMVWSNGDTFTGAFRDGRPNGPGVFRSADGTEHRGEWRDGCLMSDEARIAVLTRLSDCPAAPPPSTSAPPRRPKRLPREDFFR